MENKFAELTPAEIVKELDKYIIGQKKAKKIVAIALRNRMRRQLLPENMKNEVAPKNIIMIGPTGVGKTEIARRLSRLYKAPFIKVEATKYTEVGYVGRDVESMIRDLMSSAVSMVKQELQEEVKGEAEKRTEEALLELLMPSAADKAAVPAENPARDIMRRKLQEGLLEDKKVEVNVAKSGFPAIEIFAGTGLDDMAFSSGLPGELGNIFGAKKKKKLVSVKNAREILLAEEMNKLVDSDTVAELARNRVENMGIVFIDEIDKIASREHRSGADVSREGVQRDILPIVEGSTVATKYGLVDTTHILFIAAGAFHISKPSDLIPELQGRFPLRVELEALNADDFIRILKEPENALLKQYTALLETENVKLVFEDAAIIKLAETAAEVNKRTENIGARRLHTILETVLEDVSFNAPDMTGQELRITASYVEEKLGEIAGNEDLSRYIL